MLRRKRNPEQTRETLVQAAVSLILKNGFHAAGVEAICAEAGVTKGSFFHHFKNKDEIGLAVIEWWSAMGTREYSKAWADEEADPLDQLHAMLDIMEGFASRPDAPCVCAIGMMAQEMAATNSEIRDSCGRELGVWTDHVATLLRKAREHHEPTEPFDPEEAAWWLNSLWQGSMLIAKTRGEPGMIVANLRLARRTIDSFFSKPAKP